MSQRFFWHSHDTDVHHTSPECEKGQDIKPEHVLDGDGGKPLCSRCAELTEARAARRRLQGSREAPRPRFTTGTTRGTEAASETSNGERSASTNNLLKWLIGLVVVMFIVLAVYACGPEAICYARGGDPASNAFGAKWCELDGNSLPSEGDTSLDW